MMRFARVLLLLFLGLQISCAEKQTSVQDEAKAPEQKPALIEPPKATSQKDTLVLDSITEFPPEMDGCSCYFSRNQKEFEAGKYIYLNDYAKTAFISVKGQLLTLRMKAGKDSLDTKAPYVDAGETYEVRVEVQSTKPSGEEVSTINGTIYARNLKTGVKAAIPFIGECGC